MPDQPTTPPATPTPPAPKTQPKGYFNQAQLQDIQTAADLLPVARRDQHKDPLATKDITAAYLTGLETAIGEARQKMADTGQANSGQQPATLNATDAERALITVLQGIQSAAKQKHRMLAEDDDDATNFATDGYLIGQRLNPNRATFLQNAATLQSQAGTDDLPGFKTPAALQAIASAIATYKAATATQQESDEQAGQDRIARDKLVKKINARRIALQHAADALYPYTDPDNLPTRRAFQLPPDRPFNG